MSFALILFVFFTWFFLGSFLFHALFKVEKSCRTTLALLIIAGGGTVGTQKAIDWYQEWQIVQAERAAEERVKETQQAVMSFLEDMNPQLHRKFLKINHEIVRIDDKIQQLIVLKQDFPNHTLVVEQTLNQWQTLKQQLNHVSQDIYQQVEKAYISYRIDEIQGRKKFSVLSQELLKEANTALENAEVTKSTIEEQLSE